MEKDPFDHDHAEQQRTQQIARLNDQLRVYRVGGEWYCTKSIGNLSATDQALVVHAVKNFSNFNEDNDPYQEHDCAAFEVTLSNQQTCTLMFKIDYYNRDKTGGSEDPADPAQTTRVLTVMFIHEY